MAKLFVSNKDESVRMFESNFIEFFSKVHWSVPLFIYIPIVAILLYISIASYIIPVYSIVLLFLLGSLLWTLCEYLLHRFLFHHEFKSEFGKKIHWIFHGVHHDYPQDSKRLVMPPSVSIPLAIIFYLIFSMVSKQYYPPVFAGFIGGYLVYDMTHFAIHHFMIKNKYMLRIKAHHMKHHYLEPYKRFGVSTPLWDSIFGTKSEENIKN